jgi:hypothetical protein
MNEVQHNKTKNLGSFQNDPLPLLHPYPLASSTEESHVLGTKHISVT